MSVQRVMTPAGRVRFRARVKFHGREVATKYFDPARMPWRGQMTSHAILESAIGSTRDEAASA